MSIGGSVLTFIRSYPGYKIMIPDKRIETKPFAFLDCSYLSDSSLKLMFEYTGEYGRGLLSFRDLRLLLEVVL